MPGVSDGRVLLTIDYPSEKKSWSQIQVTFFIYVSITIHGVKEAGGKKGSQGTEYNRRKYVRNTKSF